MYYREMDLVVYLSLNIRAKPPADHKNYKKYRFTNQSAKNNIIFCEFVFVSHHSHTNVLLQ